MKSQTRRYLCAAVAVLCIVFIRTGNSSGHENSLSSGTKFETPKTYGICYDENLYDKLMCEFVCLKRYFSKGWIHDLAGKLVRKRLQFIYRTATLGF